MVFRTFLLKYGEIGIKGKNRGQFEDALVIQVRHALSRVEGEFEVTKEQGRIYVNVTGEDDSFDPDEVMEALTRVFGLVGICQVLKVPVGDPDQIAEDAVRYIAQTYSMAPALKDTKPVDKEAPARPDAISFKVHTRRANKQYPMSSMEVDALVGERLLDAFPGKMKVDVHHPDVMLYIEIREEVYIYSKIVPGPGGMPVGTNGRAQLLLSGGIDSPVAGWMIAKRGVALDATYFHAPPYTSERARLKVEKLLQEVSRFAGSIEMYTVPLTKVQEIMRDRCPEELFTILLRRVMMKIATHFANETKSGALITGESLGQVASQTSDALVVTDASVSIPVMRPLIALDKVDIMDIARDIGTYEKSIEPYEDCCTVFLPKHPVTRPKLAKIEKSESALDVEQLIETALASEEIIDIYPA
jgi:thiamine biosynthesis protein ThiI